jgi:GalNAc-alpha-(1->4)-GalNAc-alpha-(1->3)-diNAcBac-PP-undecaprenol alpha-1,4-N-acetyl-D-galactosaminyltransferase
VREPASIILLIESLGVGGAQRVFNALAENWAHSGSRVTVVTFEGKDQPAFFSLSRNIRYIRLGETHPFVVSDETTGRLSFILRNFYRVFVLRQTLRELSSKRNDAVLSFMLHMNLAVCLASLGLKLNVVVSERIYPKFSGSILARGLRGIFYLFAKKVIVQTEDAKNYFGRLLRRRIEVIANPLLESEISEYSVELGRPFILAVGRLEPQKRFDLLISAFASLRSRFPEWIVAIVGEGSLLEILKMQAATLGVTEKIKFLGTKKNVDAYYKAAEIFVLCSDFEGFPNVLLEAMAAGCACIATDIRSGPRELIEPMKNGLLISPGDASELSRAMEKLMTDKELRAKFRQLGTQSVSRFDSNKIQARWNQLFSSEAAS